MKLNGFVGKGTGKLGSSVFAISGGEQIVRQYNPQVSNPSTDAQVAQRAKFKLLTQLAAAMAGQITFRKNGLVSPRNQFVSKNIGLCTYNDQTGAEVDLLKLDITGGSISIPTISTYEESGVMHVGLNGPAPGNIDRVVYAAFKITENKKVEFVGEVTSSTPGEERYFEVTIPGLVVGDVVFAYGIQEVNSKATTRFENYEADSATDKAALDVLRSLSASDYVLSVTKAEKVTSE